MRVYKSPVELKPSNMQKKSSINFIKNVAAPKQSSKTQGIFNNNSNSSSNLYNHNSSSSSKSLHTQPKIHQKYHPTTTQPHILHLTIQPHHPKPPSKTKQIKSSIITPQPIRCQFPYNNQTQIKQLISFVHNQIQNNLIYIKSDNIYLDYILCLKEFRVRRLVEMINQQQEHAHNQGREGNQLELFCCEYDDIDSNNHLKNFQIIKCIGSGGFSKVFLVRGYGKLMAMKVINKQYILTNDKSNIINNQKTILSICSQHPFITKLETSFETSSFLVFVMEFCNGGELFNLLRKVRRMKQQQAKFYFVQTLSAIVYLHKKGIVYRDIKPENIIIDYEGHVRLADYGLSKIMQDTRQSKTYSFCGSAEYMAPEMLLKKGHSYEIDFYCLGALLYQLVIGLPPYYSRNQTQLFSNIIHNQLEFPSHVQLSDELKSFLSFLLQKQVENRYHTIEQIMNDPWMKDVRLEQVLEKRLKPPFETDMFEYNFDDADFVEEEKQILHKLNQQKCIDKFQEISFPDFFYQSREIVDLKSIITSSKHQGIFIRSLNQGVGQFIATEYYNNNHQPRKVSSSSGSVIIPGQHSREPSINRLDHSVFSNNNNISSNTPTSSQITRRIQSSNHNHHHHMFTQHQQQQSSHNNSKIMYYPQSITSHITQTQKSSHLSSVRSLELLNITNNNSNNTSKSSLINLNNNHNRNNRSLQRINSLPKPPSQTFLSSTNIYTTHKQPFPSGIKLTTSQQHIRTPNYYSVQKSSSRGNGIRLDIRDLGIKNQRNFSVERVRDNFEGNNLAIGGGTIGGKSNSASMTYLKHAVSAYQLKKSYLDGLREKNMSTKVKKSSFRNGQKISISMLNNLHYRN